MTKNIMVTGVSGDAGQGIIKGLREANSKPRVIGLDYSEDCGGFHLSDEGVQVLPMRDTAYVDQLIELAIEHDARALFSGIDQEQEILAPYLDRFDAAGCRLVVSSAEIVATFSDKFATSRWLAENGLYHIETLVDVSPEQAVETLGLPLIIKPRRGHGSQGVYRCDSLATVSSYLASVPDACAQAFVDGPEYTVALLFDDERLIDHLVMRRELRGGRTTRAHVVDLPSVSAFVHEFASVSNRMFGAINLQLRTDDLGIPRVFEVNPRFSGSTAMRVALGYNEPARVVDYILDETPMRPAKPRKDARVYRVWTELVTGGEDV